MTLRRRLITQERASVGRGDQWGSFVWGQGSWGAPSNDRIAEQEPTTSVPGGSTIPAPTRIVDVESSSLALSRFGLQAAGGSVSGRPWGIFIWGTDGWGIHAVTSAITQSLEPVVRVSGRSAVNRVVHQLRTTSLTTAAQGDVWGAFAWGVGAWGIPVPVIELETVAEREPVGRITTGVKGS